MKNFEPEVNRRRKMTEPRLEAVMLKYYTMWKMGGDDGMPRVAVGDGNVSELWGCRMRRFEERHKATAIHTMCGCEVCNFMIEEADNAEGPDEVV